VWWIEGNPTVLPKLKVALSRYPNHRIINALVFEEDGVELNFHVTNYDGMSSSIYEFGTHTQFSPDVKFVEHHKIHSRTVDSLVDEYNIRDINLLNMDLQGAELPCLKGSVNLLKSIQYIFTEVNKAEVYRGCTKVDQLDAFLSDFRRVDTAWVANQGWGDALYERVDL